jgi:hypothetical protein
MAASIISNNLAAAPLGQRTKKGPPPTGGPGSSHVHFYKLHCRKIVPPQNDLIVKKRDRRWTFVEEDIAVGDNGPMPDFSLSAPREAHRGRNILIAMTTTDQQKRKNEHDDDDQADEINDSIHDCLRTSRSTGMTFARFRSSSPRGNTVGTAQRDHSRSSNAEPLKNS